MLRRKLLLILGSLVGLLVIVAVAAIWLLQGMFARLDHINNQAWAMVEDVNSLGTTISMIEIDLYQMQLGRQRHLDPLIESFEAMEREVGSIGQHYIVHDEPRCGEIFAQLKGRLPAFRQYVGELATAPTPLMAQRHNREATVAAVGLRQDILQLSAYVREHARGEQAELTAYFRRLVLGLIIVFILLINVSVIALLRMASMVLKPVEKLVEASRQLGQENFDYRVRIAQNDEFDELGRAHNTLAEQLAGHEQRRIEVLGQVAVTLNHELNNAITIIELQLQLLDRQAAGNAPLEKCLNQIRHSLQRMSDTVASLKQIRRIVLTDYASGTKMLDLERSVREEPV